LAVSIVDHVKRQCKPGTAKGGEVQTEIKPAWITYEEAQRLTSLGRTTLWRIVKSGAVKSACIGRAVRINRKSLEDYIEREAQRAAE
jgi:excisionase family DNA binding protein